MTRVSQSKKMRLMRTFQRNKMMRPKMKTSLKVRVDLPMMMT